MQIEFIVTAYNDTKKYCKKDLLDLSNFYSFTENDFFHRPTYGK